MSRLTFESGPRPVAETHIAADARRSPVARGHRHREAAPDDGWLNLTVEPDRAVVITCRAPRSAGAGAALALADEVAALFRGRTLGRLRFGTPSVDLDGRDPDGFRAIVTLPIRLHDAGCPSRPAADAACTSGR